MLQLIGDGLIVGSIIALGAIGLTLTYSILRFANFGHGEFLAWGGYFALSALAVVLLPALPESLTRPIAPFSFGIPLMVAMLIAAALTALLALMIDALLFARLRHATAITMVIASFGAALALRNSLQFIHGTIPKYYSDALQIAMPLLPRGVLGGLRVTPDQIFILVLALVIVVALQVFLTHSTLGRAMRAASLNPSLARVAGVDVERVIRATWMLGAALAAVAGVFAGLTVQLRPTLGVDLLLPLFAAVILGGIGSVWGAVIGGLVLGLAESLAVPLIGAQYRTAVAFVVIVLILLVRPTGLFGDRAMEQR